MRWPVDGDDEGYPYGGTPDREDYTQSDDQPLLPIKSLTREQQIEAMIASYESNKRNYRESIDRYESKWIPEAKRELERCRDNWAKLIQEAYQTDLWIKELQAELKIMKGQK